jgi:hypothetical protein
VGTLDGGLMHKNFSTCPHCVANGASGSIARMTSNIELISRSDGATYHLFLQDGPNLRYGRSGELIAGQMIATFRFAQDKHALKSEPVRILIKNAGRSRDEVTKQIEDVADRVAAVLQAGDKLVPSYTFENGVLSDAYE